MAHGRRDKRHAARYDIFGDVTAAEALLEGLEPGAIVADKGYDADSVRSCIRDHRAVPNIPNRTNRKTKHRWKKAIYREHNLVDR